VTRGRVLLIGAVVLVLVSGLAVADYTRAQSQGDEARARAERFNAGQQECELPVAPRIEDLEKWNKCMEQQRTARNPDSAAASAESGWRQRRLWYLFGSGAIVVLAAAAAFAKPGRAKDG
jgi:hypothetical protein